MGQGDRAGPRQPAAAADERRHGRRVVRGAERRPARPAAARRQHAGHRVDRRHLQRLCSVERRGSMPGSRSASIVLPAPGGPCRKRWWPPAAATSSGAPGLAPGPTTSARSGSGRPRRRPAAGRGSAARPGGPARPAPRRGASATTSAQAARPPSTATPGTSEASAALHSGHHHLACRRRAAASTAGSTPRTGRTRPSRPSSPDRHDVGERAGRDRLAAPRARAQATARSKPRAALGHRRPGDRPP